MQFKSIKNPSPFFYFLHLLTGSVLLYAVICKLKSLCYSDVSTVSVFLYVTYVSYSHSSPLWSAIVSLYHTLCSSAVRCRLPLCAGPVRQQVGYSRGHPHAPRLITVIPRLTCNFERPLLTIFVDILSDYRADLWVFNCGKGLSSSLRSVSAGQGSANGRARAAIAIATQPAITPLWRSAALHCVTPLHCRLFTFYSQRRMLQSYRSVINYIMCWFIAI